MLYDAFLPSQGQMAGCPTWASWRQHRSVAASGGGGSAFPAILSRLGGGQWLDEGCAVDGGAGANLPS